MGRIVIAAYTPKPGQSEALEALVRRHHAVLDGESLVTDRPPVLMRAGDGSLVEVFEWRSEDAIEAAHGHAAVQALWGEFAAVCDYTPLANLAESHSPFAEFEALEPDK